MNASLTGAATRPTTRTSVEHEQTSGHGRTRVSLIGLNKQYQAATAVSDLTLDLPPGKITALLGPSGCGKTTTLKMIAGLIEPTSGDIAFDGASIIRLPAERRGAVMVFQNHLLFPHLSVAENVAFGLKMRGASRSSIQHKVSEMLARVRLPGFEDRRPRQLSGGQAQRVALARALVVEPRVLLLDEPLSNLDAHLRSEMRDLIHDLQRQSGITTVFVTHDQEEAVLLADRVALLLDGVLQQVGEPKSFYERPANLAVARFFGEVNFLPGMHMGGLVNTPIGSLRVAAAHQPDAAVTVTVRPENLRLFDGGAGPVENTIAAVVARSTYFGTHARFKVKAGEFLFEVVAHVSEAERFREDTPVALHFPPERLWLLPQEPGWPDAGAR